MIRVSFRHLQLFAVAVAAACAPSSGDRTATDTAASMPAPASEAATDQPMTGAATPSGIPADQEFLRMMADHHKGMILMA
ncbi:MAG: hypothetical protein ABIS03_01585, partial [Gemmatimonadaceae bacterium]